MSLVVYSNQNFAEMTNTVIKNFSNVPFKNIGTLSYKNEPNPFKLFNLGKLLSMKTMKKTKTIELNFILPSYQDKFKSNPLEIISHLIGHESEGSLLSSLYNQNLALELASYKLHVADLFSYFIIEIKLTDSGMKDYKRVIRNVFEYLAMLKKEGLPEYILKEIQTINQISFRFKNKTNSLQKAISVAEALNNYPPKYANIALYLMDEVDSEFYMQTLNYFCADNMIVKFKNDKLENLELKEKFYGVEYNIVPLDEEFKDSLNKILTNSHNPRESVPSSIGKY